MFRLFSIEKGLNFLAICHFLIISGATLEISKPIQQVFCSYIQGNYFIYLFIYLFLPQAAIMILALAESINLLMLTS